MQQREDPIFAEILSRIWTGNWTPEDLTLITTLQDTDTSSWPESTTHIFFTNRQCDEHNKNMISKLTFPLVNIACKDSVRDLNTGACSVTIPQSSLHETGCIPTVFQICQE